MDAQFEFQRNYIYTLKLDLPASHDQIISELVQEQWQPDEAGYAQNAFPTRYRLRTVTQPALRQIEQYVEHGRFKRDIIDLLWTTNFPAVWGVTADRMDAMTFIYGIFTKDCPGYSIRPHTDDRMHVLQGMIYFINGDDPDQSTYAYTDKEGNNALRVPTGYGCGFVNANLNDSWHTGKNSSTQERYSLMIGLRLKQFHT
jgi:hypothetical protein